MKQIILSAFTLSALWLARKKTRWRANFANYYRYFLLHQAVLKYLLIFLLVPITWVTSVVRWNFN